MAKHSKTLVLMATKLGLSDEEKVLSKAAELERLLQMKSTANSNITDTGKVVICLDLAAGIYGVEFDVKMAIKYAGLKSTVYTNSKKVIENLLELNGDVLTVAAVCISLNCSGVQDLAERILDDYQKTKGMDLSLPQYICMAVYQACRVNKVKVSKSKLLEKCRLKPAQWGKLDTEWTKFVDERYKKRAAKKVADDEAEAEDIEIPVTKKEDTEPQIEPYDDWKKRVLKKAHKELETLTSKQAQNKDAIVTVHKQKTPKKSERDRYAEVGVKEIGISPRRSPRKTPQKFEPYKSPVKNPGVRLLFPIN